MSYSLTPPRFPELIGCFLIRLLAKLRLLVEVSTDEASPSSCHTKKKEKKTDEAKRKKKIKHSSSLHRGERNQFYISCFSFHHVWRRRPTSKSQTIEESLRWSRDELATILFVISLSLHLLCLIISLCVTLPSKFLCYQKDQSSFKRNCKAAN